LRKAFVETLCELAAGDDRIVLLTGDLGFMALEPFRDRFPSRFFNAGVAEQNMVGLATGLAESGFRPYVYSIATFVTLRALEFIRNGPVFHHLPVRIVGMGMGFEYGHAGSSHYALEDVCVMRALRGMTVVIPADSDQTRSAIRQTQNVSGPLYYSLGKDDRLRIEGLNGRFALERIEIVCDGTGIAILAMGSVAVEAVAAAGELKANGVSAAVAIVSSFSSGAESQIADLLRNFPRAITVEAQSSSGGLGSFVAGVIASRGLHCRLEILAARPVPDSTSSSQTGQWRKHGLDRNSILSKALAAEPEAS
jgi:transketolase